MIYKNTPPYCLSSCLTSFKKSLNFVFSFIEMAACRTDTRERGWCDVQVENLLYLRDIKGADEPHVSKTYNSSICMDSFVAKSLFNATCLTPPIISAEAAVSTITVPFIVVLVILIALTIFVVLVCCFRRRKRNYEPTPRED